MNEKRDIKFIKPCRQPGEGYQELTPEYALACFLRGKIVQINLDNCSLQRMEQLPENPTMEDVKKVGLLPLVNILRRSPAIGLTAVGINEMPDKYVANSMRAYQKFCEHFWDGHKDDYDATERDFDRFSTDRTINFNDLPNDARCVYGMSYVAILQIQNIKLTYSDRPPEEQFEIYIYSMISMLDILNAFDLEIAKYAFWHISSNDINKLPENIQERRRYIRQNFIRIGNEINKCKSLAFDAAMDIHWLCGSNLAEDLGVTLNNREAEHWIGTNDHKLFKICCDIHWEYHDGSRMKRLVSTREHNLSKLKYWQHVDQTAEFITKLRKASGYRDNDKLLKKIDMSITDIEKELCSYFK